jgi:hypothetical protein
MNRQSITYNVASPAVRLYLINVVYNNYLKRIMFLFKQFKQLFGVFAD